jgi:hypothetical protein
MTNENTKQKAPGHKWDIDFQRNTKKCVRCGETWWNGPMRPCVPVARKEAKR